MSTPATRLRRRMTYLRLGVAETAARIGMPAKDFSRYITGVAKQNLHPDVFVRLCAALAVTPDQAFGLAPMPGVDEGAANDPDACELERIRASLGVLDEEGVRLAADLLDSVLRAQERAGR